MNLTAKALEAYKAGDLNGTITCSIEKLIITVLEQEVVSYCSTKGTYTFDYMDIQYDGESVHDFDWGRA